MNPVRTAFVYAAAMLFTTLSSQSPQGFNYQAVARNRAGLPLLNKTLTVETGILSDTINNIWLWKETHTVTTDGSGVFSLVLGSGVRSGGTATTFDGIDWVSGERFIRTRLNYQNTWYEMGASRLWSVPYAIQSQRAASFAGDPPRLTVSGTDVTSDSALFEVKRKDGEVIFAVYNHGVRVNVPVDTLTKAKKGGFAVGGFDNTKGAYQDWLIVSNDSIRAYFNDSPAKAKKGGFAVGGFDQAKSNSQDYFILNSDSVRFYIDQTPVKAKKGGFAVGGFDETKRPAISFLDLTANNYLIGHESGESITDGLYNSFLGYQAGKHTTGGSGNIFIGYQSGFSNSVGESNTFVGYQSGFSNLGNSAGGVFQHGFYNCYFGYQAGYASLYGDYNTMIGYKAGKNNQASLNTFIGYSAGENNTDGSYNTFVGLSAGVLNQIGSKNIFVGHQAGHSNIDGESNTFIGAMSGAGIRSGSNNVVLGNGALAGTVYGATGTGSSNVIIGHQAGQFNTNGSYNVLIGAEAGNYLPPDASNKFVLENSSSNTPLISGDFISNQTKINGALEVTGAITTPSDARLKTDIQEIYKSLSLLRNIRVVTFQWIPEMQDEGIVDKGRQTGVIAQEVQEVLPELVKQDEKGFLSVDYQKLSVIQLAAIKEQQILIEQLMHRVTELEEKVANNLK